MDKHTAQSIINKTKSDYNTIAEHFSQTRYKAWPEFYEFSQYIKDGDKVLDLGCGNGRLLRFIANKKIDYVGLDISEKLIKSAHLRQGFGEQASCLAKYKFVVGNITDLPFQDSSFDAVLAIASLYHIPSKESRQKSFQEVARVLKPGGVFVMTYWNMWEMSRIKLVFKNIFRKIIGQSKLDFFDAMKPWRDSQGKVMTQRYCHAFTLREAERLCKKAGLKVEKKYYSRQGKNAHFWNGFNGIVIAKSTGSCYNTTTYSKN